MKWLAFLVLLNSSPSLALEQKIEDQLLRRVEAQEKMLGIRHFCIPAITYIKEKSKENPTKNSLEYHQKQDTICILDKHEVTQEDLDHELGHSYADKLSESLGNGDWPDYETSYNPLGTELVCEGIAEYFARCMNNGKDDFKDSDWPKELKGFFDGKVIYSGGYHLVNPVINRYGKRGIEYLILHPPLHSDMKDLPRYQQRTLEELAVQK